MRREPVIHFHFNSLRAEGGVTRDQLCFEIVNCFCVRPLAL